jgi:dTMP kinase
MKKGNFVCFIGIDGSGKTTLANIAINVLGEHNMKSRYIYCGWRQFESFIFKPFVKVVRRLARSNVNSNGENESYISASKQRFPNLFKFLVSIDYYFVVFPKLIIPLIAGKNIASDRYFYDVIINTGVDLNNSYEEIKTSTRRWQRIFPKPDLLFLVDIPVEVAYSRKDDIPSKEYLTEHRRIFLSLANDFDMTVLDGTMPLEKLNEIIKYKIDELLEVRTK